MTKGRMKSRTLIADSLSIMKLFLKLFDNDVNAKLNILHRGYCADRTFIVTFL